MLVDFRQTINNASVSRLESTPCPAFRLPTARVVLEQLLPYLDKAERLATIKSQTIQYRNRHNTMTDRLKYLFAKHVLKQGNSSHCHYDVLIKNYDHKGRDLLVEVKPDPDCGAIRIAVG